MVIYRYDFIPPSDHVAIMTRHILSSVLGWLLLPSLGYAQEQTGNHFEDAVRPILKAHCFECHGEGKRPKGGLDVRLKRYLATGGDGGPVIVPGNAKKSLLLDKLRTGEMPPGKRKLTPDEIAKIARWIDAGATTAKPEPEKLATGFQITDADRQTWFYQPIAKPLIPKVRATNRVRTPIDAFVSTKLEAKGLMFAPDADRRTLIRRASFDLLGLPPTPAEMEAFVANISPDAYEKLLDRLLASPHYGERWGRHWLDVAGYADSEGYSSADAIRPTAYLYRDYVIRAFNADKPFDEFIHEQLAGDELVAPPYAKLSPEHLDKLIATGFLRTAPDGTATKDVNLKEACNQTVADTLQIVSTALLGITVHCAQCHNHRYDPISQVDYYQMRAIFEPAFDTKKWRTPPARAIKIPLAAPAKQPDAKPTKVPAKPATLAIRALTEVVGQLPATFLFDRGDPDQPREEVKPGHLSILSAIPLQPIAERDPKLPTSGRRLAFARSLTDPRHPATARVLVNRFWMHHFGKGIVATPGDFGFLGELPTHPELLDWLASDFVESGWKLKRLHKQIMLSTVYRQSAVSSAESRAVDPDNKWLGRMNLRRLEAEIVRDAMLAVSGKLNSKAFGPPIPIKPDLAGQIVIGVDTNDGAGRPTGKVVPLNGEEFRRSMYVQIRRSKPLAILETFDSATLNPNCERRNVTTVATQSLMLMNSRDVTEMAEHLARRLQKEATGDRTKQVRLAWTLAWMREPTAKDIDNAEQFLSEQTKRFQQAKNLPPGFDAAFTSLTNLCQAMLTANAFLYVE